MLRFKLSKILFWLSDKLFDLGLIIAPTKDEVSDESFVTVESTPEADNQFVRIVKGYERE